MFSFTSAIFFSLQPSFHHFYIFFYVIISKGSDNVKKNRKTDELLKTLYWQMNL